MYLGTPLRQVIYEGPCRRLYQLIASLLPYGRIEPAPIIVISILARLYSDCIRRHGWHIRMRVISVVGIITIALPYNRSMCIGRTAAAPSRGTIIDRFGRLMGRTMFPLVRLGPAGFRHADQ